MSSNDATSTKSGVGKAGKAKAPKVSRSAKAGIEFPVGRVARYLKRGKYAERISACAPVYLSAVLDYLAAQVLYLAGKEAESLNEKRITPTHIQMIKTISEDLDQMWRNVIIPNAGIRPRIHKDLCSKDEKKVWDRMKKSSSDL